MDLHRPGDEGHGAGGTEDLHIVKDAFHLHVLRQAGVQIRHHGVKGYAGGLKSLVVKHVQLPGHGAVGEVPAEQVPGSEQAAQALIAPVPDEALVIADDPSLLPGQEVGAEQCPGGNAHNPIEMHTLPVQHIQHAGGVHAPHGAALQHKTSFHFLFLPAVFTAILPPGCEHFKQMPCSRAKKYSVPQALRKNAL